MRTATQQPTAQLQRELGRLLAGIQNTLPTNTTPTRLERINTRNRIIEHADTIQDLLAEGLRIATTLFPTKTTLPRTANMTKRRYWTKTVQRDVSTLRNRATLLRRLAKLHTTTPLTQQDTPDVKINITNEINHITNILTTPPTLEITLHKPLRANVTLYLSPNTPILHQHLTT
jgi:hypothetical protein